jgi:Xaa-Pro aminopeptidase
VAIVRRKARAVTWPRDEAKLDRVRAALADHELDALVVRAPDNVLYLTNYWGMKGYEIVVFPREGNPILVVMEPSVDDAERNAWTADHRVVDGYDPVDPRPPAARALALAQEVVREQGYGRVGLELSLGTQASDRMVGEPTTYTKAFFDAFDRADDATPLLNACRAVKTGQELERMRLANEIADAALAHVHERLRPGMKESEVAAMWEGAVHGIGVGYEGRVEMARGFALVWSGPGIRTFTATGDRPISEREPTLFEIWVCADGYWSDLTKNMCPGGLDGRYVELLEFLLGVYGEAVAFCRDGASLAALDRLIRTRIADGGYPGQPSHPVAHGVGARAHEPPYAHQADERPMAAGMVLAIEPGIYWEGGGGLRLEDDYLVTEGAPQKLSSWPDDFR